MKILKKKLQYNQSVQFYIDKSNNSKTLNINLKKYDRAIIFCDKNLKKIFFKFKKKINKKIFFLKPIYLEPDENTKSLIELPKLLSYLEKIKCSRSDLIIAIGGGTITDSISFAASIYMRGIDLFLIPTTLMGQADATTAGKTCINTGYTKNLIGTYYLPKFVYSNINYIKDLQKFDLRQGKSEIFKYGLLGSKKLLKLLEKYSETYDLNLMEEILLNTIRVRMLLRKKNGLISNLGHTFGHAFEKTSNYQVAHGDAISVGILIALKFSLEKKIINLKFYIKILNLMKKLNLNMNIDHNYNIKNILDVMMKDKKSKYNLIGLVLIREISKIVYSPTKPFYFVSKKEMEKFLKNNLPIFSKKNHWKNLKKNEV